ncbi:hypothetical protein ONZ45_g1203 [Pleurotus djamor]|nr:hypothetical protein ONZ45_g1203 [Pleurotus djamor]
MSISEKASADFVEDGEAQRIQVNDDQSFARRTLRKVDVHLLPILAIVYSVSLIDRANIGNAYVAGMAVDLELTVGSRYSLAVLIFFVPYILFELPSNVIVRHVGAALWIGTITVLWGSVMLGMGFVTTWWELVICRALLGLLEAGYFPACAYIISTWYLRREVQKRLTGFYVVSGAVSGFSSAIAGGIAEMAGLRGLGGWQWIFIIFGCVTLLCGFAAFFLVQDFPDKNKFLTAEETTWVMDRIEKDRADAHYDSWTMAKFWKYTFDLHIWSFVLMFGAACTVSYAFAYFLPIILAGGMGYSTLHAQLLVAPPNVCGALFSFGLAILSDKTGLRAPFLLFQAIISLIGLSLTAFHTSNGVRYFGVFLGLSGGMANVPGTLGYLQNNVAGHTKRAFTTALTIGGGGVGGIIASTVFRSQDAPGYRPGLWVTIGSQLLVIVILFINTTYYYFKNKAVREGRSPPIDGRVGFYYTY